MKSTKRFFVFIMCCIMVISSIPLAGFEDLLPAVTASANDTVIYYGDLNENGRVEASDARLVLQKAASLITLTDRQMALADVNQDGKVTAMDARTVLRTAARIEAPAVFETNGTEDDTVDYIGIYSEFLKNQGKTVYYTPNESMGLINEPFDFCDAVMFYPSESEAPVLFTLHSFINYIAKDSIVPYYLLTVYSVKDGKVCQEMQDWSLEVYNTNSYYIWKSLRDISFDILSYFVSYESSCYDTVYPESENIVAIDHIRGNIVSYGQNYSKELFTSGVSSLNSGISAPDIENAVIYTLNKKAADKMQITVINKDGKVQAPVVIETTENKDFDYLSIYVEFLRAQGKHISGEHGNKTYSFYFCDAALCETDKNNEYPELAVVYKADIDGWDINTAHIAKIYTIKNKKVETVNSYISDYSLDTFYVWNNPKYQSDTIVVDKNMIHGGFFVAMTPTEHNIYDWGAGTASGFGYTFYNGYDAYLSAGSSYWSMFNSAIKPYVRYEFSSEKSDSIRISDIYNEEIKTFSF
ncbi:MAG: dockerin type I repeat-containing protein [Clostridia bacterium]|nr:dockerin type I repeat-containing protein [Clostridia bacterium]